MLMNRFLFFLFSNKYLKIKKSGPLCQRGKRQKIKSVKTTGVAVEIRKWLVLDWFGGKFSYFPPDQTAVSGTTSEI